MTTTVKLNNGQTIPLLGFGTARLFGEKGKCAIITALKNGVRHLDCAKVYGNEVLVGKAIKESNVKREALFITSKIWNDDKHPNNVESAVRLTLSRLDVSYLDLYLIHWPLQWRKGTFGCEDDSYTVYDTWKQMERLVEIGLVKSIGVSNFSKNELLNLCKFAKIKPVVNQLECHPLLHQENIVRLCKDNDILVTAWSPLGKMHASIYENNPTLDLLSLKYNCTKTQIVLAWHLKRGISPIPRSSSKKHILENIESEKISKQLVEGDMVAMRHSNKNQRLVYDYVGIFEDTPYPYKVIGYFVLIFFKILWYIFPNHFDMPYTPLRYLKPSLLEQ
eukprot:g5588.t1